MREKRTLAVAAILAVLGFVGVAAEAWACVPQPLVYVGPMSSGPAGSQVTVTALAIRGDAEVRWNSVDGPQLAQGSGPNFSVPVTVPADAAPGLYTLLVLMRSPAGEVGSTGRAAFLVTDPAAPAKAAPVAMARIKAKSASSASSSKSSSSTGVVVGGALGLLALGGTVGWRLKRRWTPGRRDIVVG